MNKDERNAIVERRYDELRAEGKHGHYECMFRVMHEIVDAELARVREELKAAREAIKRQASAARSGMDAATRVSSAQLDRAARLRAESNPDALESERAMNAQLTEENEQLRALLTSVEEQRDGFAMQAAAIVFANKELHDKIEHVARRAYLQGQQDLANGTCAPITGVAQAMREEG